jgi:hypothetical protein
LTSAANAGFADAVVSVYRGWHDLVKKEEGWENAKWVLINDLSRSRAAPKPFSSRVEVGRALRELRDAAPDRKSAERLQQSLYFLEQKPGQPVTKDDVLRRGIPWRPIDDRALDGLRAQYEALRSGLLESGGLSREALGTRFAFKSGPPGVIDELEDMGQAILARFQDRFPALTPGRFSAREVVSPSPVHNLVTCEDDALWYVANRNPTVDYNDGRREFLALHEVGGHVLHFSQLLADNPLRGPRSHLLCLAIHTFDSYFIEGIAQFLTSLYVERIAPGTPLAMDVKRSELWFAVVHRNMTEIIEGAIGVDRAAEREREYLGGDLGALRSVYEGLAKDVFFSCNVLVYHSSHETLRPLLALDGPALDGVLSQLLRGHFSPAELADLATRTAS